MAVVWSEDMSVGNAGLDQHHRRLVDLINQLGLAVQAGDARELTGAVLGELVRYVFYHFGEEERLMEEAGYADLAAHRRAHRIMAEHVRNLESKYDSAPDSVAATELHVFLSEWLIHHIRSEDRAYMSCLAKAA